MVTSFKPDKKGKVKGTAKADKIIWTTSKDWAKAVTVNAGAGNDIINFQKSKYKNKLYGEAGNDSIYGGLGNDYIDAGAGNDFIYGTKGNNTLKGGAGADKLFAGTGNDTIYAGAGNDMIDLSKGGANTVLLESGNNLVAKGGKGVDKIYAGTGNDTIYAGAGNDIIDLSKGGTNTVYLQSGNNKISKGGAGRDTIYGGTGNDTISAGTGNDVIDLSRGGANTVLLESGNNLVSKGGKGVDKIYAGTGKDTIYAGAGNDIIDLSKGGTNTVYLQSGNNKISKGGAGVDIIYGGTGNDTISTAAGNDIIYGGAGDDEINAGTGSNTIYVKTEGGVDSILAGGGSDTLVFDDLENMSEVSGYFHGNGQDLVLFGSGSTVVLKDFTTGTHSASVIQAHDASTALNLNAFNGIVSGNVVFGTTSADNVASTTANEIFHLGNGNDTITFHNDGSNNIIILGSDSVADTLVFADLPHLTANFTGEVSGKDVILRYNKIDSVYHDSVTIKDFLDHEFAYDFTLKANGVTLYNIRDMVTNTINNNIAEPVTTIYGTEFKDYITTKTGVAETVYGGKGNDQIECAVNVYSGADVIYGGEGNDTIQYHYSNEAVTVDGGQGDDSIMARLGVVTGGLGNDTIRVTSTAVAYGDFTLEEDETQSLGGNDSIWADANNDNQIYGGGGNDTIKGRGGNDSLYGGAGNDSIYTYDSNVSGDTVAGVVTLVHGGAGDDRIFGQAVKNVMYGDEGDDIITGWSGGEDIFVFKSGDGHDVVIGGNPGDTVDTIEFTGGITLDDLHPTFVGNNLIINYNGDSDSVNIQEYVLDGAINSSIDTLKFGEITKSIRTDLKHEVHFAGGEYYGTVLSDDISCSDMVSSTIHGGLGNDTIRSMLKNDTMYGDEGANVYYFGFDGTRTDTVYTISGLDTIKIDHDNITLSDINAVISGDDVNITKGASDTIILKDYMNTLVDVTIEDTNGDTISVYDKAGITVGDGNIEGTDGADRLVGGENNDTLTGHGLDDTLNGRGGSDIYVFEVGDGDDVVINGTDGATDYLWFNDTTKNDLTYNISENDLVIGYNEDADSVTIKNYFTEGNTVTKLMDSTCATTEDAFDIAEINKHTVNTAGLSTITGTALNDIITVTSENHAITGGAGNDTITLGSGNDSVTAGKGNDVIHMGTGGATLVFGAGDGHDTIYMNELATNQVFLKLTDIEGTHNPEIKYELSGNDMILWHDHDASYNYNASITIKDWATYYDPSISKVPVINVIKDANDHYYASDNILYQFRNRIDQRNSETPAAELNGTKFKDDIHTKENFDETVHGGYGDDTISYNKSASAGNDVIYGDAGADTIQYYAKSSDTIYVDGGIGDDSIAAYGSTASIVVGGLGNDRIQCNNMTLFGDYTLEDDAEQTEGGNDNIFVSSENTNETIYGGGGNDQICGRGGNDSLYGGAGDDQIYANMGYGLDIGNYGSYKNSHAGWSAVIYGGAGNDHIFAQIETNNIYGDAGDDTFYAWMDLHTKISDTSGTDVLKLHDTTTGDASKANVKLIFEIAKDYTYDKLNPATMFNGDVFILNETNRDAYATKTKAGEATTFETLNGIVIDGNTVETIKDTTGYALSNADISSLAASVASWLKTETGYTSVSDLLINSTDVDEINALYAKFDTANWQPL